MVTGKRTLGSLFVLEPMQWGLRGDPYVWRALQQCLDHTNCPATFAELVQLLHTTFEQVVGVDIAAKDAPDVVLRSEFAHGGMSGGAVSIDRWRTRLMPLLEARARHLITGKPGTAPIVLYQGDITKQFVEAVVNAANSSLLGGGGVDGAIHHAGGPEILAACRDLRASRYRQGLPTGQAVATTAGRLWPARWVIHTVGPVWSASENRSELLASCYRESLRVADELGAHTVAFPAISTGVYGWPLDDGARIAIETVRDTETSVQEVNIVLFDDRAYGAFTAALQ